MCKRRTPENTKEPKKNKKITKEEAKKRQIDQAATNIFFNGRHILISRQNTIIIIQKRRTVHFSGPR